MQQPPYLSDSVHAVLRLQDLAEGEEVCLLSEAFHADVSLLGKHTWEMRLSQPILLRPAAARMMAAKSSFSSSFFKRVLRFPRWGDERSGNHARRTISNAGFTHRETKRVEGYDVFKIQMWEPLLQLSGPTQRAGADHATQTQSLESRNLLSADGVNGGSDGTCSLAERPEFSQHSLGGAPRHHGGFLS